MLKISFFFAAELIFTSVWLLARAVILRFVIFPRGLVDGHVQPVVFDAAKMFPPRVNLVPLVHLLRFSSVRNMVWNLAGNVAMFIPSGIVLPIVYKKLNRFWKTAAAGALISLCVEVLQLPLSSRASDVDDLILNTLGVAVGYGIYAAVRRLKRKKRSLMETDPFEVG
ncbi:MAG: VanZ family protein [Lachnospiraceae bacterium]|nr:VanZ family protein [Lachnospiraceae bacterium]